MSADFGQPKIPMNIPLDERRCWEYVLASIENIRNQLIPPSQVTNLRCTPQPGANLIDFTRSDGDSYTLYINTTPSIDLSTLVRLGTSNAYSHNVGIAAVKYYYAIRAAKGTNQGEVSNWVSGTTLALGTPAAAVTPPPATEFPFVDQETDSTAVTVPSGTEFVPV